MQAQREFPASLNDVKDKFLVQYCPVGPEVKEVGADTFETSAAKDVRQTKLRVVLVRVSSSRRPKTLAVPCERIMWQSALVCEVPRCLRWHWRRAYVAAWQLACKTRDAYRIVLEPGGDNLPTLATASVTCRH